jgi:hypothetical protein
VLRAPWGERLFDILADEFHKSLYVFHARESGTADENHSSSDRLSAELAVLDQSAQIVARLHCELRYQGAPKARGNEVA